ncbi:hypothetical protein [Pyrobaculum aerophilum]|uniref:Uncharacterized protein n=1 Tax=Pyrobaculum aerophilum TaxID=13773 RepID=A0A371R0L9_9CREN|nr:hypothetical protein [Pyrobaculum aerophilum]RFA96850.1 hypothetical protein CGL51_03995 [Pyrobaculum aerophilum]RFA97118.1 hypothetical protein CGL52_10020 [Pyrobaculum aerophilum]
MGFAKRLKYRLSDLIKLEKPDALSSRYGKAFERAVLALIKAKDSVAALRTFIENYGEPHTGAFSKLIKLMPWAKRVVEIEPAPPVFFQLDGVTITAQADFIVKYSDGKKELVELKSHILKRGEWKIKAEWSLATKIMRMLYRKAGYDYPLRLIYFVEREDGVVTEEEVFIYPKDEKDDETLLNVLRERLKKAITGR